MTAMLIEKKHKIYAGLIGAALAAWAVDANFLRPGEAGPQAAAGASAPKQQDQPALSLAAPHAPEDAAVTSKWLADRLTVWGRQNSSDAERQRDVFAAPQSWSRQLTAPVATQPTNTTALSFQRDHHIAAVIVNSKGGSILIDGRLVRVGQSIGGCKLTAVGPGRADFVTPDGQQFRMTVASEPNYSDR
jgi:hypothetical protein